MEVEELGDPAWRKDTARLLEKAGWTLSRQQIYSCTASRGVMELCLTLKHGFAGYTYVEWCLFVDGVATVPSSPAVRRVAIADRAESAADAIEHIEARCEELLEWARVTVEGAFEDAE